MLAPSKNTDAVAVEDAGLHRLPNGWALATISELIGRSGIFVDGDWVESKDQDPSGDVRLIQLADVGDGVYLDKSSRFLTANKSRELKCTYLVRGDVLIARMPDPLGRACIYPGDPKTSITAVDVCIVRTGVNGPDHHWLVWFVNSPEFRDNVALLQSGSTRKRISRKNLATIALPLPPLPEQHRIVAEIEKQFTRLDASTAALNRVQANLKRYRASLLKAACEGKLVPTEAELAQSEGRYYEPADRLLERILSERRARWDSQEKRRGKYKEPVAPDTSDLPELPEGWVWAMVDALLIEPLSNGRSVKTASGGFPVLRLTALRQGQIDQSEFKNGAWAAQEAERFLIREGDFFASRGNGSIKLVGIGGLVGPVQTPVAYPDTLIRFRLHPEVAITFFAHLWNSSMIREQLESMARTTAGIYKVNQQDLSLCRIPLPPLAEQRRIVAEVERRLSVVQQAEAAVKANLARAERLRQSILKQAFSGKLVPQDPNDEPASVLLERIRAEREAAASAAKPKRRATRRRAGSNPEKQPVLQEGPS